MESLLETILATIDAGVVVHAADTSILSANQRARELLGMRDIDGRVAADPDWVFLRPDASPMPIEEYPVVRVLANGEPVRKQTVIVRRPDERLIWVEANAEARRSDVGHIFEIVVTFLDVTERENRSLQLAQVNQDLEMLVVTDTLTGLSNRRGVLREAERLISAATRHGDPLSFLMADLDSFKSVNDRLGHAVGDRLLRDVAHAIERELRAEDLSGRIGGDEFLILLPRSDAAQATEVAARVRLAVARTAEEHGATGSVGVGTFTMGDDVASLMHKADRALYDAKRLGGDTVAQYPVI